LKLKVVSLRRRQVARMRIACRSMIAGNGYSSEEAAIGLSIRVAVNGWSWLPVADVLALLVLIEKAPATRQM